MVQLHGWLTEGLSGCRQDRTGVAGASHCCCAKTDTCYGPHGGIHPRDRATTTTTTTTTITAAAGEGLLDRGITHVLHVCTRREWAAVGPWSPLGRPLVAPWSRLGATTPSQPLTMSRADNYGARQDVDLQSYA